MEKIWYSGLDNFKKNSLVDQTYTCEILDSDISESLSIQDILCEHLADRQSEHIEVLYSGGVDSELVLKCLKQRNYNVSAITGRFYLHNYIINAHDLYYADNFCRQNEIPHSHIDIHIDKFLENGDHLEYMLPYNSRMINVAIQLFMLDKCSGLPVVGGDWPWLQTHVNPRVFSPFNYEFVVPELFMRDRGIWGIANMLSHSAASCCAFVRAHLAVAKQENIGNVGNNILGYMRIGHFKQNLFRKLGVNVEPTRLKSYGFDLLHIVPDFYNLDSYNTDLIEKTFSVNNKIIWHNQLAQAGETLPGENCKFK